MPSTGPATLCSLVSYTQFPKDIMKSKYKTLCLDIKIILKIKFKGIKMKKLLGIMVMLLVFVLSANILNAAILTKEWTYGSAEKRSYEYQELDEWGGANFWCVAAGNSCGKYDWVAIYTDVLFQENPTPPETCTPEYGHGLVINAAEEQEMTLPEPFELPTYSEIWEEEVNH